MDKKAFIAGYIAAINDSKTASYSDTFEYGFIDADGSFRGGEVHVEDEGGAWLCEIYGINGDSFEGYGSGGTWIQSCENALDDLPFGLSGAERTDFIEHVQFMMSEL